MAKGSSLSLLTMFSFRRNVFYTFFQFFSLILFVLSGVDLLYAGNRNNDKPNTYSSAYLAAGSIKAATFVSTAFTLSILTERFEQTL